MEQKNLRITMIVLGSIELILPLFTLIFILPQLYELNSSLNSDTLKPYMSFAFFGLVSAVSLIQIVRGLFFKNSNPNVSKKLIILGVILGLLTVPALITFVISPIYSMLEAI